MLVLLDIFRGALRNWKAIALGLLIAAVPTAYVIGHSRGDNQGYERARAEIAVNSLEAERERNRDDADLQSMSDYDFCVQSLRSRGLPTSACEQLRGIPSE